MTPTEFLVVAALAAVALAASVVLLARGAGRGVPGCGAGSGCDAVTSSRWGRIGRVPVALLGAIAYAVVIGSALAAMWGPQDSHDGAVALLTASIALAVAAAAWFLLIQLLVLRRFCVYCTIAQVSILAAGSIVTPVVAPVVAGGVAWNDPMARAAAIGVGVAAVMVFLQLFIRPRLYEFAPAEKVISEPMHISPIPPAPPPPPAPAVATAPGAPADPPSVERRSRQVVLLGGRLRFDAALLPLVGSLDAKYIFADVVDYTCEQCRQLHTMMDQALSSFGGDVAMTIFLAPLEQACNDQVVARDPRHDGACDYTRLALAVWTLATPRQFVEFHRWMLQGLRPPALADARRRAAELLGDGALTEALHGARVAQQLKDHLTVYRLTGAGHLPKLLMTTGMLWGQASSPQKLVELIRHEMGAASPAPAPAAKPQTPKSVFSGQRIDQSPGSGG